MAVADQKEMERRREERLAQEEMELRESTAELLRNPHFQRFLWWMISLCGIYRQDSSANSSMYIQAGMRAIGLQILDHLIAVDPAAYPEMMLAKAKEEKAIRVLEGENAKHVSESEQDVRS